MKDRNWCLEDGCEEYPYKGKLCQRHWDEREEARYKPCVVCGKVFKPKAGTNVYCSSKCRVTKGHIKQSEQWRESSLERKKARMIAAAKKRLEKFEKYSII